MKNNNDKAKRYALKQIKWKSEMGRWFIDLVALLLISWLITEVVLINARIPTGSMENTLNVGDKLIGSRLAYISGGPKRGDIVIFKWPVDKETLYIKRVIGLPGETVMIKQGKIYINGSARPLNETYLKERWTVKNDGFIFKVPEGCYLMLGDNRNDSQDSRYWAKIAYESGVAQSWKEASQYSFVKKSEIVGKALFRYNHGFKKLHDMTDY